MNASPSSKNLAIKYALENNWDAACKENLRLLEEYPNDVGTLNRMAHALVKLGRFKKAKNYYQIVLKNDKTNPIALKNLKRLETLSKSSLAVLNKRISPSDMNLQDIFIEEAGKTKTIELKNIADKKTLSLLQPGDIVYLAVKRSKVFVQMQNRTYIGMLPDNIGMRMIAFINGGNEYSANIKSVSEHSITVFIRETKKMARFKNQPSFIHTPLSHLIAQDK